MKNDKLCIKPEVAKLKVKKLIVKPSLAANICHMRLIALERMTSEEGSIAIISFDNPQKKNALTFELAEQFRNVVSEIGKENAIRCAIITGKNNIFSSGGDFSMLESMIDKDPEESRKVMLEFYRAFLSIRDLPYPVIAAVNGHAIGAALAIALACDLRYFTEDAKYAANFVKLGIHPGMGTSYFLKECCGILCAQELLFTGKMISGREAADKGICHLATTKEQVLTQAKATATEISKNSPQAIRLLKRGLYQTKNLMQTLEYEAASQSQNFLSQDYKEAMQAIREKRTPKFNNQ